MGTAETLVNPFEPPLDAGRRLAHHIFSNDGELDDTVAQVAAQLRQDQSAAQAATAFK